MAHADEVFGSSLSAPGVYYGTGNANSNIDVLTAQNSDGSTLQLGLWASTRGPGSPIAPTTTNDYYYLPSAGPRASWNFDFSVNTGSDPLSAYSYSIIVSDDTTGGVAFFNPTSLPDNAQVNSAGTVVCTGCATNLSNSGFQNSENLDFSFIASQLGGFNASAADLYTITLSAVPTSGNASDPSVTIDMRPVTPTPEPLSVLLLGTGFLPLGYFGMRKRRAASVA